MSHIMRSLSLVALLLVIAVFTEQAAAIRELPVGLENNDKKEPEFLLDPDGSLLIPGIGRVMVPPQYRAKRPHLHGNIPFTGSRGSHPIFGGGSPSTGRSYVPGGDDTFVPNPGFEVPNPVGGQKASAKPPLNHNGY